MLLRKIPFYSLILAVLIIGTTSCTEDDTSISSIEEFNDQPARNGRGNNQGPRQGSRNNGDDTEVITAWNDLFLNIDQFATGMRPNATARAIAYIQLAAYETGLPSMGGFISNEEALLGLEIDDAPDEDSIDVQIALNTAYAMTTDHFILHLPSDMRAQIPALQTSILDDLSESETEGPTATSIAWGEHVASQVIAYSQTDAQAEAQILEPQPTSYIPPTGEGFWTFSAEPERALFPYWESVRTFAISSEETSSIPPVPFSLDEDSRYYQEMDVVYVANNLAREEDGEQLWIAEFLE